LLYYYFCNPFLRPGRERRRRRTLSEGGGSISLIGDTVASNQALMGLEVNVTQQGSSSGGGIANPSATSFVTNTTLSGDNEQDSGNTSHGDDVLGPITSSHSPIGQTAGATVTHDGGNPSTSILAWILTVSNPTADRPRPSRS
jgi:hypothetical protein